jgi:UDP-3-O-[3-hydroxymyristoyl] glucosamine N-acyltransferase
VRLADLASELGREIEGDPDFRIAGVAALDRAGPEDLAYVRSDRFAAQLAASRAGALILPLGLDAGGRPAIRSPHPGLDFARAVKRLWRQPPRRASTPRPSCAARQRRRQRPGPGCALGADSKVGPRSACTRTAVRRRGGGRCVIHWAACCASARSSATGVPSPGGARRRRLAT